MRHMKWLLSTVCVLFISLALTSSAAAQSNFNLHSASAKPASYWDDPVNWLPIFVPDRIEFFDNSKNWTTNYGPSYRDTVLSPSEFLACSPQFALCFHSGPDPYPCHLSPDGRSANCLCTVQTATNYTLLTAINNYPVYLATVAKCVNGPGCNGTDSAPVCKYLNNGELIPGADVISTYDHDSRAEILKALETPGALFHKCDKGPYAGCMTAPCRNNGDGTANCKCPVFYGPYQLFGKDAQCTLGGDLVNSSSYNPELDSRPSK